MGNREVEGSRPRGFASALRLNGASRARLSFYATGEINKVVDLSMVLVAVLITNVNFGYMDTDLSVFMLVTMVLLLSSRAHAHRLRLSAFDDVGIIGRLVVISYAVASGTSTILHLGGRRPLLLGAGLTFLLIIAGRAAFFALHRSVHRTDAKARTLVVGGGRVGRQIVDAMNHSSEYWLEIVGVADDDPKFATSELGAPLLGTIRELPELVRSFNIEVVIVAFNSQPDDEIVNVLRSVKESGVELWVVPRLFEVGAGDVVDHLRGYPVFRLRPPAQTRPGWIVKRVLDFGLAAFGLLVTAPLLAIVAILIYLDSGRPILFAQQRIGRNGKPFELLKFRTMLVADPLVSETEWEASPTRITRVGRVLRNTNIDELPQLWNVLKGEMSLVGPRPERPFFVEQFGLADETYHSRHRIVMGVSGWSQIHGLRGSDTSIEERVEFDNYYIDNWSLGRDFKILVLTIVGMFRKGQTKLRKLD